MAGDWIKVEHCLPDKPEVTMMAEKLKITPDEVVGKLIRLWIWADQHAKRNGNAPCVTESLLDRITSCPGFKISLEACGWLRESKGTLFFPNFSRHNSQPAKNRALTSKRQKRFRNDNVTHKSNNGVTREEKRRIYPPNPPRGGLVDNGKQIKVLNDRYENPVGFYGLELWNSRPAHHPKEQRIYEFDLDGTTQRIGKERGLLS